MGQQQFDTTVVHQKAQAILRIIRVQRHVSTAGLEDGQQADNHLQTALGGQPDAHIRADALFAQFVRQLVGTLVELPVTQLLIAKAQGDGLRVTLGLGFDALVGAVLARIALHALRPGGRQCQFAEWRGCRCAEALQQVIEMRRQLQNAFGAEVLAVVAETHRQHLSGLDHQGQRVMRLLLIAQVAEDQTVRRALQGFGHRVVFEHQNGVEQRLATVARPALDVIQRRVLMLAQRKVLRLHLLHPVGHRLLGSRAGDDRQGVDEQPQLFFDTRQLGRTPGHGRAKGHTGLAGVALQQQQPGRLQQRIEGHALLAGKRVQASGAIGIDQLDVIAVAPSLRRRLERLQQTGRLVQFRQLRSPETLAEGGVLMLQPLNVITIAACLFRWHLAAVALQHFTEQARTAPAIHEDVVAGIHQMPRVIGGAQHGQAQQWPLRQIKTLLTVGLRPVVKPAFRLAARIQFDKGQRHLALHHLQRLFALTDKTAAQHVVMVHRGLPCAAETRHIQPMDVHPQLVDVVARAFIEQRMKQHALLHRRQRVDIVDLARRNRQTVKLRLGEARQREVRRRDALMPGRAMFDQGGQRLLVATRQGVDGRGVIHLAAEAPVQLQLAVEYLAVEAQPVAQRPVLAQRSACTVGTRYEQRALMFVEAAVELA